MEEHSPHDDRRSKTGGRERTRGVARRVSVRLAGRLIVGLGVVGMIALAVVWYMSRPNDGPVRLLAARGDGRTAFSVAGSFPPADGTPLVNPRGIDGRGERLFVADSDSGVIVVYGVDGSRKGAIKVPAVGQTKAYPVDVAAVDDARIAVVDGSSGVVQMLVLDGRLQVTRAKVLPVARGSKAGAVCASEGTLLVAEPGGTISRYDGEGTLVGRRTVRGTSGIPYIGDLAQTDETIIVTDVLGGRVIAVEAETGELSRVFDGLFRLPRGVVVDSGFGDAYVVDTLGGSITDVTEAGDVGDPWRGSDTLALERPEHAWWDASERRLFVTDSGLRRVVVVNVASPEDR